MEERYWIIDDWGGMYNGPQEGCQTKAIEAHLGHNQEEALPAQALSEASGVALARVQQHCRYWFRAGRLGMIEVPVAPQV